MNDSTAGSVTRERRDNVFLIGLNRVAKRNAFDAEMLFDLSSALGEYERSSELRCALVFAHGEHFSAGLDLMALAPQMASGTLSYPSEGLDPFAVSGPLRRKPLIVAAQGACFTAGLELRLAADIALAADSARFSQTEVLRGITPSGGASIRFTRAAGWSDAMRYMMTGEEFSASEALRMRLVSEVVPAAQLLERAVTLARQVAQAAPLGVRALIQSAHQAYAEGEAAALAALMPRLMGLLKTQDVREGVMAMMQKRAPVFKGE
jgi:enoyl-CoA hydratase/carnithine racemase